MKIGLFIVNQMLDITQAGYIVTFNPAGENVMKIELTKKDESDFYDYTYCGLEGESRERVEKDIIKALDSFRNLYSIPRTNHEASDTGSEPKDGGKPQGSAEGDEELGNTGALA